MAKNNPSVNYLWEEITDIRKQLKLNPDSSSIESLARIEELKKRIQHIYVEEAVQKLEEETQENYIERRIYK